MKKLLSAIIAVTMTLSLAVSGVQAAGRTVNLMTALEDKSEIHILYNDTVVKYDDVKPVNTDGRVMIPFRAALENMGATVDYNNDNRLVTAKKGDFEIQFTLMDDTIYINKNGAQSTITMDVPMIIVSDRTLVPIRFMSNAFDMQVGWDGNTETVIILDYDDYSAKINALTPNLNKLAQIEEPDNYKASANFDISLNAGGILSDKMNFAISGKMDTESADKTGTLDLMLDFSGFGAEIKDTKVSAVADENKLYIKTDLFEKLAAQISDENAKSQLKMVASDKWYSLDLNKLIASFAMPDSNTASFTNVLAKDNNGIGSSLEAMFKTEGDADLMTASALAMELDMFEEMDKLVSVTERDNGGYEVKMSISDADFDKILSAVGGDSEVAEVTDMFNVSMNANGTFDGVKGNNSVKADMNMNVENMIKLDLKIDITQTFEKTDSLKAAEMPADSVDITDMLISLVK